MGQAEGSKKSGARIVGGARLVQVKGDKSDARDMNKKRLGRESDFKPIGRD